MSCLGWKEWKERSTDNRVNIQGFLSFLPANANFPFPSGLALTWEKFIRCFLCAGH